MELPQDIGKQTEGVPRAPIQVKPRSGTQPVLHPVWFPLSHCSDAPLTPSPQVILQTDGAPRAPVQVKPRSGTQLVLHPV